MRPTVARIRIYALVSKLQAALALNCPFGATYGSTDTRNPWSSVSDRTTDNTGNHANDTIKWG